MENRVRRTNLDTLEDVAEYTIRFDLADTEPPLAERCHRILAIHQPTLVSR